MTLRTDHIEFRDEEFSFRQDRVVFKVHTEVGDDKPTRVVVEEVREQEEQPIEGSE